MTNKVNENQNLIMKMIGSSIKKKINTVRQDRNDAVTTLEDVIYIPQQSLLTLNQLVPR